MTQSVKDALADAETLSLYASVWCDGRSTTRRITGLWRYMDQDSMERRDLLVIYHTARAAARIAFRAVPGLRG